MILWADMCLRKALNRRKLSNSGDALKLLVLNDGLKALRGWINISYIVISQKIIIVYYYIFNWLLNLKINKSIIIWLINNIKKETSIGNRGSKSKVFLLPLDVKEENTIVKEQRVDGSYRTYSMRLRFTLMDFGINFQVKIPTKQFINIKSYSTLSDTLIVNPWFITGFSDAEGSFIVSIYKDNNNKLKWRVSPYFSIHIHIKDLPLLELIQKKP